MKHRGIRGKYILILEKILLGTHMSASVYFVCFPEEKDCTLSTFSSPLPYRWFECYTDWLHHSVSSVSNLTVNCQCE